MKRTFCAVVVFLSALFVFGQAKDVTLDGAIQNAAQQIQDGLKKDSTIVVYQFQSHNSKLSDYVLKELFNVLVNSKRFTVLDRMSQGVIKAERDFQYIQNLGMVSDESLMSLTKIIGAQAIITGSLDDAASEYRFRIKVIGTETTAAIVSYAVSVDKNDKRIAGFENRKRTAGQKIGTGALNIILGLGSYLEGDLAGGITLSAGYAIAGGLFVVEALALDWDSPMVGVPATAGVAVAGLAIVYGFARPFIYNYSRQAAAIIDNTQFKIVQTSDTYNRGRGMAFQLSYSVTLSEVRK